MCHSAQNSHVPYSNPTWPWHCTAGCHTEPLSFEGFSLLVFLEPGEWGRVMTIWSTRYWLSRIWVDPSYKGCLLHFLLRRHDYMMWLTVTDGHTRVGQKLWLHRRSHMRLRYSRLLHCRPITLNYLQHWPHSILSGLGRRDCSLITMSFPAETETTFAFEKRINFRRNLKDESALIYWITDNENLRSELIRSFVQSARL